MSTYVVCKKLFVCSWNTRGLNDDDKCTDVKRNLSAQPLDVICLQETKLSGVSRSKAASFLPPGFANLSSIDSVGASGGLITAWRDSAVRHARTLALEFTLTVFFEFAADASPFAVTNVYAPCDPSRRDAFLSELRTLATHCDLPWMVLGDFNMTRGASDKNNGRFDAAVAADFNSVIDDLVLQELPLLDRRYTWSNNREVPTLVRLDRALINPLWSKALFNSTLRSLVRNTSDHACASSGRSRFSRAFF
jgi:exonuclease III